ncbi:carbohydrate ABC transporter permease [Actinomadura spongiicola]|uniref:Carbohydrate ABC transporter permease n=1 Tax=Actinomadura spongiicola TaxID=2303421 RepID=A0A372G9A4_9ACTN|nr:carbohydrate ABC transporter permease [Actinomadura spongiicola]RFS81951.1 carbohydrate ABC transporter permease [Actinomadura spongiicola]
MKTAEEVRSGTSPSRTVAAPSRPRRRIDWSHVGLAPLALLFVLPLLWEVLASFMADAQINKYPPALVPDGIHLDGYRYVFTNTDFPRWFLNSVLVSLVSVVSNLVLCSLAAYGFARLRFRGSGVLFGLLVATIIIPFQLTMIPTFILMKNLGLADSLGALILPNLVSVFGVYLLRQFFLALPRDIEEAAIIDGCGRLQVLVRIVLPLARPALATLAALTFLTSWNDLTWPLIAISTDDNYTLQLGLTTFAGQHHTIWSAVMAGNVITTLPVLIVFLLTQRTFIQSLTSTAVKG